MLTFPSLGDWSSKLANGAKEAATKRTADALQIAARKIGDLSEMLQEPGPAAPDLCQLINGQGIYQDYHLQPFFEKLAITRQTSYLIVSIMGSQSGGKSTLLNHMVAFHTCLAP